MTSSPVSADLAISQEQSRTYSRFGRVLQLSKYLNPRFTRGRQTPRPQVWSFLQTDASFMRGGPPALPATGRTKRHVFKSCFSPAASPRSSDARLTGLKPHYRFLILPLSLFVSRLGTQHA